MKERARHARRILRDHRREPGLYTHRRLDFKRGNVEGYTLWVCPRCPGRHPLVADMVARSWRVTEDSIQVDGPLTSGQHRLVPDAEERRAFDPYVGLERLARDFQEKT